MSSCPFEFHLSHFPTVNYHWRGVPAYISHYNWAAAKVAGRNAAQCIFYPSNLTSDHCASQPTGRMASFHRLNNQHHGRCSLGAMLILKQHTLILRHQYTFEALKGPHKMLWMATFCPRALSLTHVG